ncbi:MAG: hypothetical protein ACK5PQ_02340 [Alphaproteobacteria bacterium]
MVCGLSQTLVAQPSIVDSKLSADLLISNQGDRVAIQAEVVDGFAYRFPFTIATDSEKLHLVGLTAESVCNCVQVKFIDSELSKSCRASGEIFLRPKSGQLVEGIRIRGFREGFEKKVEIDQDNVACLVELKVKVINPLQLSEGYILVKGGRFEKDEIAINLSENVEVRSVTGSSSEPDLQVLFDSKEKKLTLKAAKPISDGRIYLDFDIETRGVRGRVSREIGYGERVKTRVVPSILQFKYESSSPQQKCILISPDFLKTDPKDIDVKIFSPDGTELPSGCIKAEFRMESQDKPGKAVLIVSIVDKQFLRGLEAWMVRLVDRHNVDTFVDIACKWL